ncbi:MULTISPECIES: histidine phosphatase family protein [unclassified Sphingomonas]|uniref:histidine phosphatase family protein n=1 Tax=unclassified Sphingomonas TaxID=196159 RepID=UPI0006F81F50|nr:MULTISPECIES: histidine phosphatase family protein [unclassified Sphingomonas]KQX19229.1 phosphoglycerate mutase [Sphingomonas sp. Root1294]KQY65431.1 phosphoglycerate mutase [Sphingomonas sp. Root50]KRB95271.1 phosphoglycerate mutase [Sphingomonas sp. Root720]
MQRWPDRLWIVRHGQSAGNVARDAAHEAELDRIAIKGRDVDVPLSRLGEEQADALGHWFAAGHGDDRPDVLLSSPYRRALQTARHFRDAGGAAADERICMDERLREKEFGILDGLTTHGVANHFPDQAAFRRTLGKFYHRPPGGESWADVILRLRSLLDTVSLHYGGRRVMIFAHQVVVLCLRYIIENLDEEGILAIDREADVANCSVTEYRFDPAAGKNGNLVLERYNTVAPIVAEHARVTRERDSIVAARG